MGQRDALSFLDIELANAAYKCSAKCPQKKVCQNGGFMNHRCECFCPQYLSGPYCENLETNLPSGCKFYTFKYGINFTSIYFSHLKMNHQTTWIQFKEA
jgi:hypothetical protein